MKTKYEARHPSVRESTRPSRRSGSAVSIGPRLDCYFNRSELYNCNLEWHAVVHCPRGRQRENQNPQFIVTRSRF